jgi:hypothetical protein
MVKYQDISFENKQARDEFKTKWIAADYDMAIAMLSDAALADKVVNADVFNDLATKIVEAEERNDDNFPEYRITGPWTQLPTTIPKSKLCFVYTNWRDGDYQSVQLYEYDVTQWNPCYCKISPKVQANIDAQTADIAELTNLTPDAQVNALLGSGGGQEHGSVSISNINDYNLIVLCTNIGDAVVYLDADGNSGCGYIYNTNQGAYVYAKRTTAGIDFYAKRTQSAPVKPYVFVNNIYGLI